MQQEENDDPGDIRETKTMSTSEDEYNMRHEKRGIALIINNERFNDRPLREGTEADGKAIKERLENLEFSVEYRVNLKSHEIKAEISKVANRDHSHHDCFVCVIMSHGEEGVVYGTDGPIEIKELVDPFKKLQSLAGKPKLFFIQACRGHVPEDTTDALGVRGDSGEVMKEVTYRIPTEADFLIAYSVVPGVYALEEGSWFIQALCKVLDHYGTSVDLMTMMTRVNKIVAHEFESNKLEEFIKRKKQIPCITSMLTKEVFFHPKKKQERAE